MFLKSSGPLFLHWFLLLGLAAVVTAEPLRLPNIFGDHMVLQQELPVVIWGWADAGQEVTVSFGRQTKSVKADDAGRWRVPLEPLKANTTATRLRAQAGDQTVAFDDVLVGEVWLCSGQSNMEWRVANTDGAEPEIANADAPLLRHIEIDHIMRPEPVDDVQSQKGWEVCTPNTVASFTAAGYFFGKELREKLHVPVGLVNSSWGGSNIEAFTSREGFKQVPALSDMVQRIEASLPHSPAYKKAVRKTLAETRKWLAEAKQAVGNDERVSPAPVLPQSTNPLVHWQDPTNKHNAMINGLAPYRIRGSIWYQGEANRADGMLYVKKTEALVKGWRQAWGQPDLPYYYVQIAPYLYGQEDPHILPMFWEAQAAIEGKIPHTGMAVIHDVGNLEDIHPRDKRTVGHRLALLALAGTYGMDLIDGGPQFERMAIEGDTARVFFKRVGSGLTTSDGKSPDWFEIAGENGLFVPAQARIDGLTVVLRSDEVQKPSAIRYAWSKRAEPNLRAKDGFPVSAFRSGRIQERALLDATVPQAKEYTLIYSYDVGASGTTHKAATYRVDRAANIESFDRVAYFLALKKADEPLRYAWVSMNPVTRDATKLGVPTSSANATFRQWVDHMDVQTNVEGVETGEGLRGYIEFWPNNYASENSAAIDGASNEAFDFGDTPRDPLEGYGSMQIHNPPARQTVLAVNRWWDGQNADVGIGNSPEGNPDYTFRGNAGAYQLKRLMVLVRSTK